MFDAFPVDLEKGDKYGLDEKGNQLHAFELILIAVQIFYCCIRGHLHLIERYLQKGRE